MTDTITLIDEAGQEYEFEVEAFLDVEEGKYAILIPLTEDNSDEAIIMRIGEDEQGNDVLFDIDDDNEWDRVADAYDTYINEEFEID